MNNMTDTKLPYVECPKWRTDYGIRTSIMLEQIPFFFERTKHFVKNPENEEYVEGFREWYLISYITECNRGEKTGTQTVSETEDAFFPKIENATSKEERNKMKTQNLVDAIKYVFGDELIIYELKHEFNPALAKKIHERIGKRCIKDPGSYRTSGAKPSGYNYSYLDPEHIEKEMDKLFRMINEYIKSEDYKWYEVAAKFLERFLSIHPFSNGNGRTARLLLSALLVKYSIVPVSLFNIDSDKQSSNEIYLTCLDEAHRYDNLQLLNSLVIESTFRSLYYFVTNLDLMGL